MRAESTHPAYRPDIDGLRAVAVVSVVVYHAYPGLFPAGFIGVDIFFVISGYLISSIIIKSSYAGTFSFKEFYARRIKRILPALLLVLIACLVFGWFGLLADEFSQLGRHVLAGIGFVSNLVLWNESGYFDNASHTKPLLHLWSLGIEEQFYIFWPILVGLLYRNKAVLLIVMIALVILSFTYNVILIRSDMVATFYSPLTRVWELLIGGGVAYATLSNFWNPSTSTRTRNAAHAMSVGGGVLLVVGFLFINDKVPFPGWWALLPVLASTLLIAAGSGAWVNRWVLANPVLVWIGLISYPLYLWHWPLLTLSSISLAENPPALMRALLVAVSVVLAWLTFRFVEMPVRSGSRQWPYTKILVILMIVVGLSGAAVWLKGGFPTRTAVKNSDFTPQVAEQFMGPLWKYTSNQNCLSQHEFPQVEEYKWWFCMQSEPASPTIAIVGNSYANQLYPGFVNNKELSHHSVLSIGTCDIAQGINTDGEPSNPCYGDKILDQASFIDNLLADSDSIKYVVLDGFLAEVDAAYIDRLAERIEKFERADRQIIIFVPHLRPVRNPKSCFSTPLRPSPGDCNIPEVNRDRIDTGFQPLIDAISERFPDVLFFDQNDVFCESNGCSGIREGIPMHRDMRHTSEFASIALQPYFNRWARINVPEMLNE